MSANADLLSWFEKATADYKGQANTAAVVRHLVGQDIRSEIRLTEAAKALGWNRDSLLKEWRRLGLEIMGKGKLATVFADDIPRFQKLRADEAVDDHEQRQRKAERVHRAVREDTPLTRRLATARCRARAAEGSD